MKTTLHIDVRLIQEARRHAESSGNTLSKFAANAIRYYIDEFCQTESPHRLHQIVDQAGCSTLFRMPKNWELN